MQGCVREPDKHGADNGGRPVFLPIEIHVGREAMELLKREAARRGVKASRLIERVAEIVATDDLFHAVLDR